MVPDQSQISWLFTWVFDRESLAILAVNAARLKTYGYTQEEFLRFKITDTRPREDVPSLLDSIQKKMHLLKTTAPGRHRSKPARLVVAIGFPGKKRAEDALKQSEERRRMITAIKDYSVITLDRLGQVKRIQGYRADHILVST